MTLWLIIREVRIKYNIVHIGLYTAYSKVHIDIEVESIEFILIKYV